MTDPFLARTDEDLMAFAETCERMGKERGINFRNFAELYLTQIHCVVLSRCFVGMVVGGNAIARKVSEDDHFSRYDVHVARCGRIIPLSGSQVY